MTTETQKHQRRMRVGHAWWKRAGAIAALLFVTTYSGLSVSIIKQQQQTSQNASEATHLNDRKTTDEDVYYQSSQQPQRSMLSLQYLLHPDDNAKIKEATPRIVGGTVAPEYPSYGFNAGSGLCGGTLIHPEYVLTLDCCCVYD